LGASSYLRKPVDEVTLLKPVPTGFKSHSTLLSGGVPSPLKNILPRSRPIYGDDFPYG
jgi:hypothetical protein